MEFPGSSIRAQRDRRRWLLSTVTGEPCQPARLYYLLPSKSAATRIFSGLRCMSEEHQGAMALAVSSRVCGADVRTLLQRGSRRSAPGRTRLLSLSQVRRDGLLCPLV